MSNDSIERAPKTTAEAEDIVFDDSVTSRTGEMFAKLLPGAKAFVVVNKNIFGVTGEEAVASFKATGVEFAQEPYIFPGKPMLYGNYRNVEILHEYIEPLEGTVVYSIGVGTLNDIAKLAPGEPGHPYMNVRTTASVDDSAALGVSTSRDDFKITRSYPDPAGPVADNDVVCNAPKRLAVTGYGDLIEKIPTGMDWVLADALGIKPANEYMWNMVQGPLRDSLADPEAIGDGSKKATGGLMKSNLMSDLAMQADQSSHPASGTDHQLSHVRETRDHGLDWESPPSHGLRVGIGAVAPCAIWEKFLETEAEGFDVDRTLAAIRSPEQVESQVYIALRPRMREEVVHHSLKKGTGGEELVTRVGLLKEK